MTIVSLILQAESEQSLDKFYLSYSIEQKKGVCDMYTMGIQSTKVVNNYLRASKKTASKTAEKLKTLKSFDVKSNELFTVKQAPVKNNKSNVSACAGGGWWDPPIGFVC